MFCILHLPREGSKAERSSDAMSSSEDSPLRDERTTTHEAPDQDAAGHGHHVGVTTDWRLHSSDDASIRVALVEEEGHVIFGRWKGWKKQNRIISSKCY